MECLKNYRPSGVFGPLADPFHAPTSLPPQLRNNVHYKSNVQRTVEETNIMYGHQSTSNHIILIRYWSTNI